MAEPKKSGRRSPFKFIMALSLAVVAMPSGSRAQAQEILASLNKTKPAEVRIVSTEFTYAPAQLRVNAGRAVTLVLDNSGAETEHGIFLPAFGFRLLAWPGGIARKTTVFDKPGEYEFICDVPGHREAGMKGTLIVVDRSAAFRFQAAAARKNLPEK